ncbi:MAG: helix-turn-helix transcriptional regulator [Rectinemataceae bacterium]|jgi:DNA-binding CsgD family transcriptional regulator
MRLGSGPLSVRIDAKGPGAAELLARATEDGIVLAQPGEAADLVAMPSRSVDGAPAAPAAPAELMPKSPIPFSPRELEILDYLVDGWSNAEIASVLHIGVRTVRFHLGNIYGRLGISRRGEAVREAVRLGLVRFDV